MKTILQLAMLCLVAFALTGCGGNSGPATPPENVEPPPAEGPTEPDAPPPPPGPNGN